MVTSGIPAVVTRYVMLRMYPVRVPSPYLPNMVIVISLQEITAI